MGIQKGTFLQSCAMAAAFFMAAAPRADAQSRPERIHARAFEAIVVDAATGKILYEDNAHMRAHPASTTKLMTAYLTLQALQEGRISLQDSLKVSARANSQKSTKMGLRTGTKITVEEALGAMLVPSANDAPVVLAEGIGALYTQPGHRAYKAFIDMMNDKAQKLGMHETRFMAPVGFNMANHYSTAADMAILARAIIDDFPEYYPALFNRPSFQFRHAWNAKSTNPLINPYERNKRQRKWWQTPDITPPYAGVEGMKTGTLDISGMNLVATAKRGDDRVIAVVFGAASGTARSDTIRTFLDFGFLKLCDSTVVYPTQKGRWFCVDPIEPIPLQRIIMEQREANWPKPELLSPEAKPHSTKIPPKKGIFGFLRKKR